MDKERLLSQIKRYHSGSYRAASSKELEAAFFVSSREIRDAINVLRQDGEPICSGNSGYFYAVNEQEIRQSIRQLGNRIKSIAKAQRGLKKAAAKLMDIGQMTFGSEVIRN